MNISSKKRYQRTPLPMEEGWSEYIGTHIWLNKHYPRIGVCRLCKKAKITEYALKEGMVLIAKPTIWLIKNLCIDTNADTAKIEQDVTFEGKKVGDYRITIEKLCPHKITK